MSFSGRKKLIADLLSRSLETEIDPALLSEPMASVSTNLLHLYAALLLLSREDIRLFILDEPTAVLSSAESRILFSGLQSARRRGSTAVLITHRISEALEHADSISVLRRGRLVGGGDAGSFRDLGSIHRLMFGDDSPGEEPPAPGLRHRAGGNPGDHRQHAKNPEPSGAFAPAALELSSVSVDFDDLCPLRDVSLRVGQGEILALSGIWDEGLEQLERLLSGRSGRYRGNARMYGQAADLQDIGSLRRRGTGIVPSQRKRHGIAATAKAWENIGIYLRSSEGDRPGIFSSPRRRFKDRVKARFDGIDLDLNAYASSFSGGMLQKLIVTREIAGGRDLLILANPGWGLDPQQRALIHESIIKSAESGTGVLILTSEIDEARRLGDRLGFVHDGRIFYPAISAYDDTAAMEACFLGRWERTEHA
jgi:ABC-type uncharacterized transport system ATPase subunit